MMDVSKFCCKPPNPPPSVVHAPQKQAPLPAEQHNPVVLYVQQQQQGGGGGAFPAPPPPAPPQHAGDFQYHQQYSQQQQQPPPYPLQQGYGYQNNDFYSPQHVRSKQKQHVPTSCTPSNSIYSSSKVNIFQNYYHQYNEAENKDMEQTHTGYVATVTAVAGGSPNGNVSSSSYFSSNSSSPSASCLTPRSTSRCDSARSAESSCSSTDSGVEMSQQLLQLSSFSSPVCTTVASTHSATPPNLVFVQQQQARHAATSHVPCTPPPLAPAPPTDIAVPSGWRRLLVNNTIVYVSPSGAELCSRDALRQYLCTTGTCKCGLECPLHLDRIFSFDPKVTNRAWPLITEPSELTRLCNHKRKQASLTAGPRRSPLHRNLHPDPAKECTAAAQQVGHTRRRRRKNHGPYDGVLVSQLLAQRDRLVQHPPSAPTLPPPPPLHQHNKDSMPPRVSEANSYPMWRFQGWDGVNQMHQLPPPSLPPQQPQQLQFPPPPPPPQQHQQQLRPPCHTMVPNMPSQQQQQQQFRHYSPVVTTSNNIVDPRVQQQQHKPQQQVMYGQFGDPMAKQRPPPPPYMYNTPGYNYQQQQQQQQQQAPMVMNNQQPATSQWNSPCQGMYDREVPLHRLSWDDVSKRKKLKTSKRVKLNNQCPNVDVRHIPMESPKLPPQQPEVQQQPMSFPPPQPVEQNLPSFMEDPNGYLAQQTALLNSTILRQTGVNVMRPVTSLESSPSCSSPLSTVVPLPSNVIVSSKGRGTPHNSPVIFSQANSVSSSYTSQPLSLPDSASECQACSMNNAVAALYQAATVKADVVLSPPEENPVTSSTLTQDKASPTPDPKGPIQGGTVSTSEVASYKLETETPSSSAECDKCPCEVTTVGSGHTVSSNTVTSVQAGRAQTVTVTVSNPTSSAVTTSPPTFPVTVTKSPLEMVQSVVSSIQVPPPPMQQQQPQQQTQIKLENGILDHNQLLKSGLPPGHILVSSNGQLIMATQPQKLQPPVSTSQMIPTMNMGQSMVQLVNTLPCNTPLLLQSGMIPQTVTVEGMGSPLQLTLTGNVLHQGQLTPDMSGADLLGMGHKKKGKKRSKSSPQQQQQQQNVASMLQLHNSPMLMQNFQTIPTQQQAPLLQTVTILPNNKTQFLQFPTTNQQQGNGSQQSPQQQAQQQFGNIGGHLLTSPQNSINLIQPFNLLNSAGSFVPNFPLQQILQGGTTLVMPSLQGLQGMVTLPDGTLVSPDPNHGTVQLQLQNVNGQQVLTSVQSQNMFGAQQNLIATPGMVIRAPAPQTQVISNKITNQVISQNGQLISPQSQFLVNGAFTQQTALNGLMVNTGQQVTLTPQNSSPNQTATLRGPDFIQCMNMNGQPMIIPCSSSQATVPTSQPQQNPAAAAAAATLLQQNTTIVQQQTTLVANNQQNNATNAIMNPNFILNSNLLPKPFQELAMPLLLQKHSVSTQTAGAQTQTIMPGVASVPVTQVATLALSSPPDTTTHQAPADTTTSSPLCESMKPGTPTADFVSSSEPDPETYAWANRTLAALTAEEEVESSTKQLATEEKRLSCKRKHSDLLVIEARPEPTQELEDPGAAK